MVYLFDTTSRVYARSKIGEKPSVVTSIEYASGYASCIKAKNAATTFGRNLCAYTFTAFEECDGMFRNLYDGKTYASPEQCVGTGARESGEGSLDGQASGDTVNPSADTSSARVEGCEPTVGTVRDVTESEIVSAIENLQKILLDIRKSESALSEQLGTVDRKISDVMHYLEFNPVDENQSYQLCVKIKELRLERRRIKNMLARAGLTHAITYDTVISGNVVKAIEGLDHRKYTPREPDDPVQASA